MLCSPDTPLGPGHGESDRPSTDRALQVDHVAVLGATPHVSNLPAVAPGFADQERARFCYGSPQCLGWEQSKRVGKETLKSK